MNPTLRPQIVLTEENQRTDELTDDEHLERPQGAADESGEENAEAEERQP